VSRFFRARRPFTKSRNRSHANARKVRIIARASSRDGPVESLAPTSSREISSGLPDADARAKIPERALRDELPAMDHAEMIGEPLDDLEDVGGEEDRPAVLRELVQEVLDQARGQGVDPLERLVQE
jgi:hypothetical protein